MGIPIRFEPDGGELRSGLPVPVFSAGLPAPEAGPGLNAASLIDSSANRRKRYAIPAVLVAGWGGLFAYCAAYLREDLPFRPAAPAQADRRAEVSTRPTIVLPEMEEAPVRPAVRAALSPTNRTGADPSPANPVLADTAPAKPMPTQPVPATPLQPSAAQAAIEYAGTWGPTPAACRSPSRRRGYLPATITADRARAGRTLCTFHDGHRVGNGWTLAAECSDRGRHWSSQVRLVVEGDRLTWTSNRGSVSYTRCTRRSG